MLRYTSLVLGVITVTVTATHSFAKWKVQYTHNPREIQAWYRAQKNAEGVACCLQSDGHPYFGKYRLTADGGAELQLKGGPYKLPSYMVLKGLIQPAMQCGGTPTMITDTPISASHQEH